MLYFGGLFGIVTLCLWVFAIVDVITTDEGSCRNLPKVGWLLLVLLFPLVGSIAWLVAGRPHGYGRPRSQAYGRNVEPDDDEEFLRRCRERAEEQRRKGREGQ